MIKCIKKMLLAASFAINEKYNPGVDKALGKSDNRIFTKATALFEHNGC